MGAGTKKLLAVATVAGVVLVGGILSKSTASAQDFGGPTVYLSRHGGPTKCSIHAKTVRISDNQTIHHWDRDSLSCDATLSLDPLTAEEQSNNAKLEVQVVNSFSHHTATHDVVQPTNNLAVCFLVKSDFSVEWTNDSTKGGGCNGKLQ
jgi:hypothetical protein